jgi:protein-disulfide isomerase
LAAQGEAEQKYHIDSTPTFIINGKPHPGEMTYDQFAALVSAS